MTDRVWLAHVVWPNAEEVTRLGAARVGRRTARRPT